VVAFAAACYGHCILPGLIGVVSSCVFGYLLAAVRGLV
jgi:anaerobic C4-dicarboxylate transporter